MSGLLLLALEFLKRNWRACVLVAFACAVAAALLYAHHRVKESGRAEGLAKGMAEAGRIQKAWDDAVARGQAEIAAIDLKNAAREATAKAEGIAIGESRVRDQRDNLAARDRLIADLRTGNQRLHNRWQACLSGPQAGDAAEVSGGSVRADELRREIAEQISEADDADSRHARLVEFVQVQQKLCEGAQ